MYIYWLAEMPSSSWHSFIGALNPFLRVRDLFCHACGKLQQYSCATDSFIHHFMPSKTNRQLPSVIMATLRLLTLCAIVSTALSFVAVGPPSRHTTTAAATTRPTFTAWGSRGSMSRVGTLGAGMLGCVVSKGVSHSVCTCQYAEPLVVVVGSARTDGTCACVRVRHRTNPIPLHPPYRIANFIRDSHTHKSLQIRLSTTITSAVPMVWCLESVP